VRVTERIGPWLVGVQPRVRIRVRVTVRIRVRVRVNLF
jgi:hypothetical protein